MPMLMMVRIFCNEQNHRVTGTDIFCNGILATSIITIFILSCIMHLVRHPNTLLRYYLWTQKKIIQQLTNMAKIWKLLLGNLHTINKSLCSRIVHTTQVEKLKQEPEPSELYWHFYALDPKHKLNSRHNFYISSEQSIIVLLPELEGRQTR